MSTSFRHRLSAAMQLRNVSQAQLAARLNCDPHQVSAWARGEFDPALRRFRQICETLSVTADFLLGRSDLP